jgi:hypothetical protein
MSERELTEITLSSGKVAKIITYFTRGETNEITRLSWGDAEAVQQDDGTVKITKIPVIQGQLEKDATVLQGTKFIDGVATTVELINDLPIDDFNQIYLELSKIKAGKKNEISKK